MIRPPKSDLTAREKLERENLNEKPGETVAKTIQRTQEKRRRARELNKPDSPDREESATVRLASVAFEMQEADSRRARMRQEIPRSYKKGDTIVDIAGEWGISTRQVHNILNETGIEKNRRS